MRDRKPTVLPGLNNKPKQLSMKFSYKGTVEMHFEHDPGSPKSKVIDSNFRLDVSTNLKQDAYNGAPGQPTRAGVDSLLTCFIQGLASVAAYGQENKWKTMPEYYETIHKELARIFSHLDKNPPTLMEGELDPDPQKSRSKGKATYVELVVELSARNEERRYDEIIRMAHNKYFHDFKAPEDASATPKAHLMELLARFPELEDIRQAVIRGDYDEESDADDALEIKRNIFPGKGGQGTKRSKDDLLN